MMRTQMLWAMLLTLMLATFSSSSQAQLSLTPTQVTPPSAGFEMTVRLDQRSQTCLVDIQGAPAFEWVALEAVVTNQFLGGMTFVQTFTQFYQADHTGRVSFVQSLHSSPMVLTSSADIHAMYVEYYSPTNYVIHDTPHWVMTGVHLNSGHAIASQSPRAYESIVSAIRLPIPPRMTGRDARFPAVTNAFTLDDPSAPTPDGLSGSGTWYAAGPASMYQASSGPAGVFTAN